MTEAIGPRRGQRVLEVGTGSGYQAAVLAELVGEVYTVELLPELAESAKKRVERLGYRNVHVKAGDGYLGWPEKGPFDAVIVTCGATEVPRPLFEQLKPGGKMVIPVGEAGQMQRWSSPWVRRDKCRPCASLLRGRTASARCETYCPCVLCPYAGPGRPRESEGQLFFTHLIGRRSKTQQRNCALCGDGNSTCHLSLPVPKKKPTGQEMDQQYDELHKTYDAEAFPTLKEQHRSFDRQHKPLPAILRSSGLFQEFPILP
jgi:SAM-dependent methyltransferase